MPKEKKLLEVVSKFWIASKGTAQADEKAQHIQLYVSILKKPGTPPLGVRRDFETASSVSGLRAPGDGASSRALPATLSG